MGMTKRCAHCQRVEKGEEKPDAKKMWGQGTAAQGDRQKHKKASPVTQNRESGDGQAGPTTDHSFHQNQEV